jgi:uncharacterized membrane protein
MIARLVIATVLMLAMDFVWLKTNYDMYAKNTEAIQKAPMAVRRIPAVMSYLLMVLALALVLWIPELRLFQRWLVASTLGLIIYGVYNATNAALLKDYDTLVALKDTLWGTFLLGTTVGIVSLF